MKKISSVQEKFCLRLLAGCAAAALLMAPGRASAQTIDYGALEALFGEPVTTSATGSPQRAPDVPVTMEIVTADQIRRSGARTIPDALKSVSGMSVWRWSRTQEDVSVRGYNQALSPRLLVLINGRQVYQDDYAFTNWSAIPIQLDEIRQIEVVKGPNAALFGFNAVGGVINIITYNPMYDKVNEVSATAGTGGYWQGGAVVSGKLADNKVGARLSANILQTNDYSEPRFANPFANNNPIDPVNHGINLDTVFQVTDKSQLRLEASDSDVRVHETIYYYFPINLEYQNRSARASYDADTKLGMLQTSVYRNWLEIKQPVGGRDAKIREYVTVAQAADLFQIGNNHHFRVGAEFRNNTLGGKLTMVNDAQIRYNVYAASGMWEWSIRPDLDWTNAVREDYLTLWRTGPMPNNGGVFTSNAPFDSTIAATSYNSGLVYRATPSDTFRLTTARGLQIPSLLEFGYMFLLVPPVTYLLGNPDLKPTEVTNYELGYDRKVPQIDGAARFSVFYQNSRKLKRISIAAGGTFLSRNIGDSNAFGAELGLGGKFGEGWSWDANYMLERVTDHIPTNDAAGILVIPYDAQGASPVHTAVAHLGYTTGPWEADARARLVSRYDVPHSNGVGLYSKSRVPSHVMVDARLGYKVNEKVTVALTGQQMEQAHVMQTSGPLTEREVFLTVTGKF